MNQYKQPIRSFRDLEIFQNSYQAMLIVMTKIIFLLPQEEKYDLCQQLRRSSKAIPRLIAEGYSKCHQKSGFKKYLSDALAECNETIVSLEQCRDLFNVEEALVKELIGVYDKTSRQIYKLMIAWSKKPFNY